MKSLIVLSHLMSEKCELVGESIDRANLAISMFDEMEFKYLITSGWAYRSDCDIPISDVFKSYIASKTNIQSESIVSLPFSRDTVGDALFSLRFLQSFNVDSLVVVTSDYHVTRAEKIFSKFFNKVTEIRVIGVETNLHQDKKIIEHEQKSTADFESTFAYANFNDIGSLFKILCSGHPYYNGKIYPKLENL